MEELNTWLANKAKDILKEIKAKGYGNHYQKKFLEVPLSPINPDLNKFSAPASGTIYNVTEVLNPEDCVLKVKGRDFQFLDLLMGIPKECMIEFAQGANIIQTFLCYLDVHTVKFPTSGIIEYWRVPGIKTRNLSMLPFEDEVLGGSVDPKHNDFLFVNERVICRIVSTTGFVYYLVLIADREIDQVAIFEQFNPIHKKGSVLGSIRRGSECIVIVPKAQSFCIKNIGAKKGFHVETGIDDLFDIEKIQPTKSK